MIDFLTWLIMIGAAMGIGFYLGWSNRRYHERLEHKDYVQFAPMTSEETRDLLNAYLQARLRHPSNYHRHPEMEEEDDC